MDRPFSTSHDRLCSGRPGMMACLLAAIVLFPTDSDADQPGERILHFPEDRSLGRLAIDNEEVGPAQGRSLCPALNLLRKALLHDRQPLQDKVQRPAQPQGIGVVLHICAGRSEVDNSPANGTLTGKDAYLGH